MRNPLRVVFFGTPEFVIPVLDSLHSHFQLVGVVTTPDAAVGRKQIITPTPIAKKAEEFNIPALKPVKFEPKNIEELTELAADLFVVASYGKIIPQVILDIPKHGSINIHPSKLPLFRGATPIQSQILEGINDSAISFILVDSKMDHGPLLHQEEFTISDNDTNETLHDEMFKKAADVLPKLIIEYVAGDLELTEQNHVDATFCKIFNRESGYFELDTPPSLEQLNRMIRAFYPWPTAWTKWSHFAKSTSLKLRGSQATRDMTIKFLPNGMVQPEGKKPMKWKEFLNGYPTFPLKLKE